MAAVNYDSLIEEVGRLYGYHTLKEKQKEVITAFLMGNDVFACLPTGYGKSVCYAILPTIFDKLRNTPKSSIVICISPLIALMSDQQKKFQKLGISAEYIAERYLDLDSLQEVKLGLRQLLFISPESLLNNNQWRNVLLSDVFQNNLVCVAVDEAHCVPKWGSSFREVYHRVGEVRSLIPPSVNLMALTATASKSLRVKIGRLLSLQPPILIYIPPIKPNIIYYVKDKSSTTIESFVKNLSWCLVQLKLDTPKVIIFCRQFDECSKMYRTFKHYLGTNFTFPSGAPDLAKYRVVDMYTGGCTQSEVKETIIKSFCSSTQLRIVISTIAFGMGVDVPDVQQVIHWSASDDLESYIQESGRAGRNGELCCGTLYYERKDNRFLDEKMINYCTNNTVCKRVLLFADFEDCNFIPICKCYCCSVCMNDCKCSIRKISKLFNFS